MGRQRVKEGPPGRGDNVFVHTPIELPEHEVQEPEDAHKKDKPCLILSRHDLFKTRSVKTHFTMLVSVPHPMSTSPVPVIEYVATASAVTYTELSPVTEYVAPAPADTLAARSPAIEHVVPTPVVTYAAICSVIEYVASALVVFYAAPATVIEHSAL